MGSFSVSTDAVSQPDRGRIELDLYVLDGPGRCFRATLDRGPVQVPTAVENDTMAAHAGERARETGDFHCQSCDATVHVTEGQKIPNCPCGGTTYESRTNEPGNKSSSRSAKSHSSRSSSHTRKTTRSHTTRRSHRPSA